MEIKIYKYRRMMSYGVSKWKWHVFFEEITSKEVREFFEGLNNEYSWSERHRGYEWVRVEKVPKDIYDAKVNNILSTIKEYRKMLRKFKLVPRGNYNSRQPKHSYG